MASWNSLTGNGYADLLLGHVSMFSQGLKSVLLNFAANEYDFYALDNWKIGRRLTVNFGTRVNHIGWWYNKEGNIAIFDPAKYDPNAQISDYTGIQTHAKDASVSLSGYKPVGWQLAPSAGFSWDVTGSGKTVVRGGFGVNYFRDEGISAAFKLVQDPPLQSMDYFAPSPGLYLSQLSSIVPSASPPWLNTAMPNESKMPRTYSYNLTVQRQIPGSTLLSVAYVGNQSSNLVAWPDINPVPEGAELGVDWPGNDANFDAPYRTYHNIAGIFPAAHRLKSNYNSLQLTAQRGDWFPATSTERRMCRSCHCWSATPLLTCNRIRSSMVRASRRRPTDRMARTGSLISTVQCLPTVTCPCSRTSRSRSRKACSSGRRRSTSLTIRFGGSWTTALSRATWAATPHSSWQLLTLVQHQSMHPAPAS
ncbi:MAG TPA: hypothetical protein VF311_06270 [Terriglobales bacterium]